MSTQELIAAAQQAYNEGQDALNRLAEYLDKLSGGGAAEDTAG
jgi:hypothetical protein